MKKKNLFVLIATCFILPSTLYAGTCTTYSIPSGQANPCEDMIQDYCDSMGAQSYYMSTSGNCYGKQNCDICQPGYTKVTKNLGDCTNITYTACECSCSGCTSDTTWSAAGTGYQKKVTRYCDCSSGTATCTATTDYRCAAGYYGSSTNGTSGCTKCPDSGTSSNGSTVITSCCLPSGSAFSDTSGAGSFTAQCCYTK